MWRAGFDECHGSDICNGTNWANVQADAQAPVVYTAIWIPVAILFLLGNMVLIVKKHTAGLSISWKVLVCIQLLAGILHVFLVPIPAVSVPAHGLRATANEVDGYYCAPRSLSASHPPPFPRYSFTRWRRKTRFAATTWWR